MLRQWPNWAGYAASGWAVLFGAVLLLVGHGALYGVSWLGWLGAAAFAVGAGFAVASVRRGRWVPAGLVTAGLWGVVLAALAGSAFVLLDLISWVINGAMLGRDGRSDWGPVGTAGLWGWWQFPTSAAPDPDAYSDRGQG